MNLKRIDNKFLKTWAVGASVVIVFACICFFALLNVKSFENTMVTQTQQHLLNIAKSESQSLEEMFRSLQSKLHMLALDPRVQDAITNYDPSNTSFGPEGDSPSEALFEQLSSEIDNLYRLDAQGIVQNRIPYKANRIGEDFSQKPGIKYVLENQTPYISDVFEANSGRHCMSICSPVFREEEFLGALRTIVYLDNIQKMVNHVKIGEAGYAWVLSRGGNIMSHHNERLIGKNVFDLITGSENEKNLKSIAFKSMSRGNYGATVFADAKLTSEKTIMAWAPVIMDEAHWSIGVCTGYNEISSPIKAHSRNMFLGVVICLSLLAGTSIAYYRVSRRKTHLEAQMAIGRVNDELQLTSIEREEISIELENLKKMLDIIISNVPLCVFWKDTDLVYRGCNKNFAREAGVLSPEEVIGKTDSDLDWKRENIKTFAKLNREVIKSGIPILNAENTMTLSDGSSKTTLSSRVPLQDIQGAVIGVMVVYADITDTKNVQSKIDAEHQNLQDVMSSIDDGLVVVDGTDRMVEANSCFAKLAGDPQDKLKTNALRDISNKALASELEKSLESFRTNDQNCFSVCELNDMKYEFKLSSVISDGDTSQVLIQVIDTSKLLDARKDAEDALAKISHDLRTPISSITGFAELLQQENLTEEQTEFVNTIHVNSTSLMDIIAGAINDAGIDIEDNDMQHAKVEESEQIESPEETIEASEETEERATKAAQEPEKVVQKESKVVEKKDVYDILLVDDVEENRMLAEVMLKGLNYRITSCVNGVEAVELAEKQEYDLILMDIQMPQMDGYEATRTIRTKGKNQKTGIIAMTASTAKGDELRCLEVGCDDFIYKPINKEILLRKIGRFIEQVKQMETAEKGGDITSFLAENPDYTKMIETFVNNLPNRIGEMQSSLDEKNLQDLAFKIHALKGLGGFAGFPIYTEKAKNIEQMINDSQLDKIQEQIDELSRLCRRTKLKGPKRS